MFCLFRQEQGIAVQEVAVKKKVSHGKQQKEDRKGLKDAEPERYQLFRKEEAIRLRLYRANQSNDNAESQEQCKKITSTSTLS